MVTAAQARSFDVTPQALARFARQGILERLVHGVYRAAFLGRGAVFLGHLGGLIRR